MGLYKDEIEKLEAMGPDVIIYDKELINAAYEKLEYALTQCYLALDDLAHEDEEQIWANHFNKCITWAEADNNYATIMLPNIGVIDYDKSINLDMIEGDFDFYEIDSDCDESESSFATIAEAITMYRAITIGLSAVSLIAMLKIEDDEYESMKGTN